jgi:hypothetical protein
VAKKKSPSNADSNRRRRPSRTGPESGEDRDAQREAAKEKVRCALEALRQAEEDYAKVLEHEPQPLEQLREMSLGDAVDRVLEWVRKYPGGGVVAAAAAGFLLGRVLRRVW